MKTKFILMIAIAIPMFILLGCGMVNMLMRTKDFTQHEVTTVYRDRNESERTISVGMAKREVIEAWGEPHHIYYLDESDRAEIAKCKAEGKVFAERYDADEFWIYCREKEPLFGKEFSYEIYFKGDKVIKIIENELTHRLIGPGDL